MLKNLLFILFMFFSLLSNSQYVSKFTGDWNVGSNWDVGVPPPLVGGKLSDNVTIAQPNTITLNGNLEVQSGAILIVDGILIVTGNVTFKNGSKVLINSTGILQILSSGVNSNNSTEITVNGQIIVNNDFNAGAGSTITGMGTVTVGGASSGPGTIFGENTGCSNCTFGGTPLPIELIGFYGEEYDNTIVLTWIVASQVNNDYYTLYKSMDAFEWVEVCRVNGAGNSNQIIEYSFVDENIFYGYNYYKLRQTDYDEMFEEFSPIVVNIVRDRELKVYKIIDLSGRIVDKNYKGIVIELYKNGLTKKVFYQ